MTTDRPRNVVLLTVDALRADHLSCHGYSRETTPTLDDLAAAHLHMTNAHSASSHTREAVPAILTGRYPDVAVDDRYHLAAETVATTLSEAGFATGAFHSNPFVSRAYEFDRGFDTFDDDLHLGTHKLVALAQRALDKLRNRHYARAETINRRSLDWIDSLGDRRFLLWNHYMDPHGPYAPPPEYRRQFRDRPVSARRAGRLYRRAIRSPSEITDAERRMLVELYDAEIRYLDDQIGSFLNELERRDLLAESLVIVTADHGDAFGEHGHFEHPRYLFEELVRVPFIAFGPGVPPFTSDRPASTLDVVPTILAAVGESFDHLPGSPVHRLVDGDGENRYVFSQARSSENPTVRRYRVWGGEGSHSLELDTSRWEETLSRTAPAASAVETALHEHCADRLGASADSEGQASGADEANPEIAARLKALGYRER